jgi:hypothetical protein
VLGLLDEVGTGVGMPGDDTAGLEPAMLELIMLDPAILEVDTEELPGVGGVKTLDSPSTDEVGVGAALEGESGGLVLDGPATGDEAGAEELGRSILTPLELGEDIGAGLDTDDTSLAVDDIVEDDGIGFTVVENGSGVTVVENGPGGGVDITEDVIPGVELVGAVDEKTPQRPYCGSQPSPQ